MEPTFRYPSDKFFITGDPDTAYIVLPEIEPKGLKGCFKAKPEGLELNENTGEIDINKSRTGIKYTVTFTPCEGKTPEPFKLVIRGIDYVSDVFYLTDKPEKLIIRPFLDGDVNNDKDLPPTEYDLPDRKQLTASYFKLAICTKTGKIDLRKTIRNCALGIGKFGLKLRPANGACKDFSINYRQEGAQAINNTKIQIHYFNTPADVPDFILKHVNDNRAYLGLPPVELPNRPPRRGSLHIYMDGDTKKPAGAVIIGGR